MWESLAERATYGRSAFLAAAALAFVLFVTTVSVSRLVHPGDELLAVGQMVTILVALGGYGEHRTA